MKTAGTVIIGAGVVGASVAYHLTARGVRDVLLLDSEPEQGRGSTGAATGGVRAQFETDINILMSLYSLEFFRNWDIDCGYDPAGYLFFATTAEQLAYLTRSVARQRELGVRDVDIVDAETIRHIVPGMNCDDMAGGSFGKHDGFINPLAVMNGFTRQAVDRGATLSLNTRVISIDVSAGSVRGVTTNEGKLECGTVILCTGARAAELALTAGVDLPVAPQKRQIVWARTVEPLPPDLPMVIDVGCGFHFRPAKDWRGAAPFSAGSTMGGDRRDILFAFPDPDEPCSTDTCFDEDFVGKVYDRAAHRAGFLFRSEVVPEKCRAGLYENTPDHHAILGGCDIDGLYFANGFSGHGVMHSPATGRAISEIVLDGSATFLDVSCLALDRFAKGKQLCETAFI